MLGLFIVLGLLVTLFAAAAARQATATRLLRVAPFAAAIATGLAMAVHLHEAQQRNAFRNALAWEACVDDALDAQQPLDTAIRTCTATTNRALFWRPALWLPRPTA